MARNGGSFKRNPSPISTTPEGYVESKKPKLCTKCTKREGCVDRKIYERDFCNDFNGR